MQSFISYHNTKQDDLLKQLDTELNTRDTKRTDPTGSPDDDGEWTVVRPKGKQKTGLLENRREERKLLTLK